MARFYPSRMLRGCAKGDIDRVRLPTAFQSRHRPRNSIPDERNWTPYSQCMPTDSARSGFVSVHFARITFMSSKTNGFAQGTVLKVAYSMLGMTSCVVLARAGLEFSRPKRLTISDALIYFSFACYVTMCALYIALSPYMQRLYDVGNQKIPPYPELAHDTVKMTKMVFAAPCMFWMTLWSVKASLLLLYRKLLVGLSTKYTVIWWGIAGICLVVSYSTGGMRGSNTENCCRHMPAITSSTFDHVVPYRGFGREAV